MGGAGRSASTPILDSTCASTPASTFLEIQFGGPAPGRQGLNVSAEMGVSTLISREKTSYLLISAHTIRRISENFLVFALREVPRITILAETITK